MTREFLGHLFLVAFAFLSGLVVLAAMILAALMAAEAGLDAYRKLQGGPAATKLIGVKP